MQQFQTGHNVNFVIYTFQLNASNGLLEGQRIQLIINKNIKAITSWWDQSNSIRINCCAVNVCQ